MDHFEYRNGVLCCEDLPAETVAERFGTPAYVYSRRTFEGHYDRVRDAFADVDPLICFSVKSCQNTHICRLLRERGSGFDVVSGGELHRALAAGADPAKIVYAGVGKTDREIVEAFDARIGLFNVESESELEVLNRLACERGVTAVAALRVNPNVDARTHAFTTTGTVDTKFGVALDRALAVFESSREAAGVRLCGIHVHIGSPVRDVDAHARSVSRALELCDQLRAAGHTIDTIDIGGGYGAYYGDEDMPAPADYAAALAPLLRDAGLRVIIEPGRAIAANAGVLLTRVLHVKETRSRRFVIVDASMTDLVRPALYGAYHFIWPVNPGAYVPTSRAPEQPLEGLVRCDVVGPVCESGDFLARERLLPPVRRGDVLAVFTAGAYAMTMASQYNSRPRAPEVLVSGATPHLIRRRETYEDLLAAESVEST